VPSDLRIRASRAKRTGKAFARSAIDAARHGRQFAEVEAYCMFIGYPRSGHSLVGSLLDAHPDVVIAHELDALRYVDLGFRRRQIWALLMANADRFTAKGRRTNTDYDYAVPGQWQGRTEQPKVLGDKKGRASTLRLGRSPELLDVVRRRMGVPLRVVHVVRNPYDNIATMLARGEPDLESAVAAYEDLVRTNADLRRRLTAEELVEVRHEDLLARPQPELGRLIAHLGLPVPDGYLEACASILFPSPKQTRGSAPWTPGLQARVAALIDGHDFLAGYRFDDA
jgi:hypothetical protein